MIVKVIYYPPQSKIGTLSLLSLRCDNYTISEDGSFNFWLNGQPIMFMSKSLVEAIVPVEIDTCHFMHGQ
jgi:hypothetical protein